MHNSLLLVKNTAPTPVAFCTYHWSRVPLATATLLCIHLCKLKNKDNSLKKSTFSKIKIKMHTNSNCQMREYIYWNEDDVYRFCLSLCILIGSFGRSNKLISTVISFRSHERYFVHMTELSVSFRSNDRQFVPLSLQWKNCRSVFCHYRSNFLVFCQLFVQHSVCYRLLSVCYRLHNRQFVHLTDMSVSFRFVFFHMNDNSFTILSTF